MSSSPLGSSENRPRPYPLLQWLRRYDLDVILPKCYMHFPSAARKSISSGDWWSQGVLRKERVQSFSIVSKTHLSFVMDVHSSEKNCNLPATSMSPRLRVTSAGPFPKEGDPGRVVSHLTWTRVQISRERFVLNSCWWGGGGSLRENLFQCLHLKGEWLLLWGWLTLGYQCHLLLGWPWFGVHTKAEGSGAA